MDLTGEDDDSTTEPAAAAAAAAPGRRKRKAPAAASAPPPAKKQAADAIQRYVFYVRRTVDFTVTDCGNKTVFLLKPFLYI